MLPRTTMVAAAARDLATAAAAIAAGADLIDLSGADPQVVTAVRDRYPGVLTCGPAEGAALAGERDAALRTRALLICADPDAAGAAEASGISRDAILVEAGPDRAAALIRAGWQVIVDTGEPAGPHAAAAVAALSCWLGAAAVRSRQVAAVRRAIDMTASIRGTRPVPGGYVRP